MIRGREDLEILLAELEERLRKANIELTGCPEGRLVQGVRDGKRVYFQVVPADVGRDRQIAINKRPDIIKKLARKKYLETEIKILEKDIAVITQSIGRYVDPTADNILKALPDRYRKLSERWFFQNEIYANINESRMYENSETEWIEYVTRWTMEPFEQSTFEPQLRNKTTARGIKVRTKSYRAMIFFFPLLCFNDFLNFLYWHGLTEGIKIFFKKDQDESFQTLFK